MGDRKHIKMLDYITGKYVEFTWHDVQGFSRKGSYVVVVLWNATKYMFPKEEFTRKLGGYTK